MPALVAPLGDADDAESHDPERNELRRRASTARGIGAKGPSEAEAHVDALLETALAFAAFDPNYSYGDEDEEMDADDEEEDEEYEDDYGDEDDDDDTSWKVRGGRGGCVYRAEAKPSRRWLI